MLRKYATTPATTRGSENSRTLADARLAGSKANVPTALRPALSSSCPPALSSTASRMNERLTALMGTRWVGKRRSELGRRVSAEEQRRGDLPLLGHEDVVGAARR